LDGDPLVIRQSPVLDAMDAPNAPNEENRPIPNQNTMRDSTITDVITDIQPQHEIETTDADGAVGALHVTVLEASAGMEPIGSFAAKDEVEVFNPESGSKDGFNV